MKKNVSEKTIRHMGQRMSNETGDPSYRVQMEGQQRQFVDYVYNSSTGNGTKQFAVAGIFAAAAAAAMVFFFVYPQETSEVPFWIGSDNAPGSEGSFVEASAEQQTPIRFDGGTLFHLRTGGSARVIESNMNRVIVDLTSGELECNVKGNRETRWFVRAGTYRVVVTGTAFTVSWAPHMSNLKIAVKEGSVLVSGGSLNPHGVVLSMGDHLEINAGEISIANKDAASQTSPTEPALSMEVADFADRPIDVPTVQMEETTPFQKSNAQNRRKKKDFSPSEWKERYAQKDFPGTVAAAKKQGLEQLAQHLNADDLWQLSRAARLARDGAAAQKLLLAVRTRFPGSQKARNATFLLGRVFEEFLKDPVAAKRWYEEYLSFGVQSALSQEALGRLIGVCQRSGFVSEAKGYAKTYLSKFPQGPFAKRANSVL